MSLVEVVVAMMVLSLLATGVLQAVIQSRKMTDASILQSTAVSVTQGYLEQIKNIEFDELPYHDAGGVLRRKRTAVGNLHLLPYWTLGGERKDGPARGAQADNGIATRLDSTTLDPLFISSGSPVNPAGFSNTTALPEGVVENVKWMRLNSSEALTDDLRLRLWVWVNEVPDERGSEGGAKAITIVYFWRPGGSGARESSGTLRTIRSAVPSF